MAVRNVFDEGKSFLTDKKPDDFLRYADVALDQVTAKLEELAHHICRQTASARALVQYAAPLVESAITLCFGIIGPSIVIFSDIV